MVRLARVLRDYDAAGVKATGGTGGLVGVGGACASVSLMNPTTQSSLGQHTLIDAPLANLQIVAQNTDDMKSAATQTVAGGITSNDLALKALGVHQATVPGQVAPGIPCWVLGDESRFPGVPYVIFPGNVGTPKTLADVITLLRGA